METFLAEADYPEYLYLMAEWCNRCIVRGWAYCLTANHLHLIAMLESEEALRRAGGEAHRRYTRYINFHKRMERASVAGEIRIISGGLENLIAVAR